MNSEKQQDTRLIDMLHFFTVIMKYKKEKAIKKIHLKSYQKGIPLVIQWLGLCALTAKGLGSISAWGTKIPHAAGCGQNKQSISLIIREM